MEKLQIGIVVFNSVGDPTFTNNFMKEKIMKSISEKQKNIENMEKLEKLKESDDKRFLNFPEVKRAINHEMFDDIELVNSTNENPEEEMRLMYSDLQTAYINKETYCSSVLQDIITLIQKNKDFFSNFRQIGIKNVIDKTSGGIIKVQILARFNMYEDTIELIYHDISLIQKAEEYKAETKYKTLLLSKVAHEFKNPLISISELVNTINEDNEHTTTEDISSRKSFDFNKKHFNSIKLLVEYMLILVRDFDLLSLKELNMKIEINLVQTELSHLVDFCLDIFKTRININSKLISLTSHIDTTLPRYVMLDDLRLKQIIINLLSNSYKFTENGEINLKLLDETDHGSRCIKVIVLDTGTGIEKDKLSRIAEPFAKFENKNNPQGAGLGLGIVKEMVNNLGKNFTIDSEFGKGTSISFLIPLRECDSVKIEYNNNNDKEVEVFTKCKEKPCMVELTTRTEKTIKLETIMVKEINKHELLTKKRSSIHQLNDESQIEIAVNNSEIHLNRVYKIIVVEDENLIRNSEVKLIKRNFSEKGEDVQIACCQDGAECLNILYQAKLNNDIFDAILTDESMSFIRGTTLCEIINGSIQDSLMYNIKLFIASSFDANNEQFNKLKGNRSFVCHFDKPINKNNVEKLFSSLVYCENKEI
jgi:signal transduction histidine kinase